MRTAWSGRCPERAAAPITRKEGHFGRLKIESFHGCDWPNDRGVHGNARRLPQMVQDVVIKGRIGLQEPMQYRRDLGLAA